MAAGAAEDLTSPRRSTLILMQSEVEAFPKSMVDDTENHTLKVLRQLRREQADTASSLARLIRNSEERLAHQISTTEERLNRQMATLRDDLETTIKMEIGGALAHLETRLEDRMDERLDAFRQEQTLPHP